MFRGNHNTQFHRVASRAEVRYVMAYPSMLSLIVDTIPAVIGYGVATITVSAGIAIIAARVRRSLFGPTPVAEDDSGLRAFLQNFE